MVGKVGGFYSIVSSYSVRKSPWGYQLYRTKNFLNQEGFLFIENGGEYISHRICSSCIFICLMIKYRQKGYL